MTDNWLLALDDIKPDQLNLVGRKALNLATLHHHQLSVPPSLVITTNFFEAQINHFAYRPIWAGSPDVAVTEGALQFLADFLKSTPLAPHLETALKSQLDQICPAQDTLFAVRSSAIDEDLGDQSFAGCYLTELGVPRDLLPISLTRCWASALTGQSIQYRLNHGLPLQAIKIAVLIQPMLKPEIAGVGFTQNPITGERDEILIEVIDGLGEGVVKGQVKPHTYHLRRQYPHYPIIKKSTADFISTQQLHILAQLFEQVEAIMGKPQDIEWASQDQDVYLLQTRPITTIAPQVEDQNTEWGQINYVDLLPTISSPLVVSLLKHTQKQIETFCKTIGLDISKTNNFMKVIYGRPYLNLDSIKQILTSLGLDILPLLGRLGYVGVSLKTTKIKFYWPQIWRSRKIYLDLIGRLFNLPKAIQIYEHLVAQNIEMLSLKSSSAIEKTVYNERLIHFKCREQIYNEFVQLNLLLNSGHLGLLMILIKLSETQVESVDDLIAKLLLTGQNQRVIHHHNTLLQLAYHAQSEIKVHDYFLNQPTSFTDYHNSLSGTQFLAKFDEYLDQHPDLAPYPYDLGSPRYHEMPHLVLQTIQQYIHLMQPHEANLDSDLNRHSSPLQEIQAQPPSHLLHYLSNVNRLSWRYLLIKLLLAKLDKLTLLKQRLFDILLQITTAIRIWDLQMAQIWVENGLLDDVDDYFWLSFEEIERVLIMQGKENIHLKSTVATRKITYAEFETMEVPSVVHHSDIMSLSLNQKAPQDLLSSTLFGLPISPGQVQGTIQIINHPTALDHIPTDRILVVPSNDPAYAPYFAQALGLIVEMGGILSHSSILAREYGLPAVSNIIDARTRLKSGDRVFLDGSTGIIQVLETIDGREGEGVL